MRFTYRAPLIIVLVAICCLAAQQWRVHFSVPQSTQPASSGGVFIQFGRGVSLEARNAVLQHNHLSTSTCFSQIAICQYTFSAERTSQQVVQQLLFQYQSSGTIILAEENSTLAISEPSLPVTSESPPQDWYLSQINTSSDTPSVTSDTSASVGIIASSQNQNERITALISNPPTTDPPGIAPHIKVVSVPLANTNQHTSIAEVTRAVLQAVNQHLPVLCIGFSLPTDSPTLRTALQYAQDNATLIVMGSGDTGKDIPTLNSSAGMRVGATNQNSNLTSWSNYGNSLDLVAPGVELSHSHTNYSGTAMAAALTSGAAAILKATNPTLSALQLKALLLAATPSPTWNSQQGWGSLRVPTTPQIQTSLSASPTPPSNVTSNQFPLQEIAHVELDWQASNPKMATMQYNVYRDNLLRGSTTSTHWTDTSGDAGTFRYTIQAVGYTGALSPEISTTITVAPKLRITRFSVTSLSSTSVKVEWDCNLPATGTITYGTTTTGADKSSTNHSTTLTNLHPGQEYIYHITATRSDLPDRVVTSNPSTFIP